MNDHRTMKRYVSDRCERIRTLVALLLGMVLAPSMLQAQSDAVPKEHFGVEAPAHLDPAHTRDIYRRLIDTMVNAYALSKDPSASRYRRWRLYNSSPYQSATHGNRYVNNYANPIARDYGRPRITEQMPKGSILAKDSFSVTEAGEVFPGPLFLMEKMDKGFNPDSRDWRYSMIMPDGSYFGVTGGDSADRVAFCVTCHQTAGDENDHLFFVPEAYRNGD